MPHTYQSKKVSKPAQIQKKAPLMAPKPGSFQPDSVHQTEQPLPNYTPLPADWEASQHPLLRKSAPVVQRQPESETNQPNHTGMPNQLKAGLEHLSGMDLSDVRVHRNSSKPRQMQALAYTQGTNIYLGPGQERHLPHEGWHVVQQMQGRVRPSIKVGNLLINQDAQLEREAEDKGNLSKVNPLVPTNTLNKRAIPRETTQLYLTLGRVPSDLITRILFNTETKKYIVQEADIDEIFEQIQKAIKTEEGNVDLETGEILSPSYISARLNLAAHIEEHPELVKEELTKWVTSSEIMMSNILGWDKEAHWREYEDITQLGLALAHETLPETTANKETEKNLAVIIQNSHWINQKLQQVVDKIHTYMNTNMKTARQILEKAESHVFGSYLNSQSYFGRFIQQPISWILGSEKSTQDSVIEKIRSIHDIMERWSSAGAGGIAAKIHDTLNFEVILPSAEDVAYEAIMLDQSNNLTRGTHLMTEEEAKKGLAPFLARRKEKRKEKIEDIQKSPLNEFRSQKKKEKFLLQAELILVLRDLKAGLLMENDPELQELLLRARQYNLSDLEAGIDLPLLEERLSEKIKRSSVGRMMFEKFVFPAIQEKQKKFKPGVVDKTSRAKGRVNVGTRDEFQKDTLLARLYSIPITAGRSMTTARLMQLVEYIGGDREEITAMAYGLFSFWQIGYNRGLTPVHTFYEVMDVATNYGVPYKALHYPKIPDNGNLNFMEPEWMPVQHRSGFDIRDERNPVLDSGFAFLSRRI